jgi:cardiolipin synthase A/B
VALRQARRQVIPFVAAAALAIGVTGVVTCCGGSSRKLRAPRPEDAVLPTVDDGALWSRPDLVAELDEKTMSVERSGNAVELLVNGKASFARRFANAEGADLILVKTFIFTDDEVGREVAKVLSERARAGAYVVLQYDVKGSVGGPPDVEEMLRNATTDRPAGEKNIIRGMREAGVVIVPSNSPSRAAEIEEWASNVARLMRDPLAALDRSAETLRLIDHCDHEKYWITGHRTTEGSMDLAAILGGMNIASEYAYGGTEQVDAGSKRGGWRDTDIEVKGPVVNDIVERFFDVMDYHLGGEPQDHTRWNPAQVPVGQARARFVWNHPLVQQAHAIEELYRILIEATPRGSALRIETAYFSPTKRIRVALRSALERGARVTILSNSDETNDIGVVADAGRAAYLAFLELDGILALFERLVRSDIGEGTLHSKVASFGTTGPIIVGSANLDAQSALHNSEGVLLVYDPAARAAFDAMFNADVSGDRASRVTIETVGQDSEWDRFRQWAADHVGWYWM